MPNAASGFDDGASYERHMGRWSRAAGSAFLDWVAPPANASWLDVGCGTGVFTKLILDTCSPVAVSAIDPSQAQIDYARRQPFSGRADFQVADAQKLPFPDGTFDVVASALVISFMSARPMAFTEMRRVARVGGTVAGYVWDSAAELAPNWPSRLGLRQIGADVPPAVGAEHSSIDALHSLFERSGLDEIATRSIDLTVTFLDFNDLWQAQMARLNAVTRTIMASSGVDRARLVEYVRTALPASRDGSITCPARASAIKARVPV